MFKDNVCFLFVHTFSLGSGNKLCKSYHLCTHHKVNLTVQTEPKFKARWPGGRGSDSGARGRGFDSHSGHRVVSLSKIHLPPQKVLVIPRKRWLCPSMTEK